jgi:hypothetical protein|tara:strand:+ start:2207 stop:2740 length:534 start_codon:yes stop_codon:yes gene_type:complete
MNKERFFELIDSLTQGQGAFSKTPMGREVLFLTDPYMNPGFSVPENVDIQEIIRGIAKPNSPIQSQFSSILGRFELNEDSKSKSIDDIIKQSDLVEFLSKAQADKTQVETPTEISTDNMARRIGYSSDIQTPNDLVRYLTTVRPAFEVNTPENNSNVDNFFKMIESIDAIPKGRKKS